MNNFHHATLSDKTWERKTDEMYYRMISKHSLVLPSGTDEGSFKGAVSQNQAN